MVVAQAPARPRPPWLFWWRRRFKLTQQVAVRRRRRYRGNLFLLCARAPFPSSVFLPRPALLHPCHQVALRSLAPTSVAAAAHWNMWSYMDCSYSFFHIFLILLPSIMLIICMRRN